MENYDEIMNDEEMVQDDYTETEEHSGLGTGAGMLIGAGLTLAVTAAVKFGKKAYKAIKAKKELRQPVGVVEPTDEQIHEVTTK